MKLLAANFFTVIYSIFHCSIHIQINIREQFPKSKILHLNNLMSYLWYLYGIYSTSLGNEVEES